MSQVATAQAATGHAPEARSNRDRGDRPRHPGRGHRLHRVTGRRRRGWLRLHPQCGPSGPRRSQSQVAGGLRASSLSLVDGMPVLWASRLLGDPLPERVSGSDLVLPLMQRAGARGWKVTCRAASPERPMKRQRSSGTVRRPRGGHRGRDDPPRPTGGARAEGGRRADPRGAPDLLLVGLGAPKQEIWIAQNARHFGSAVAVVVGASLDFIAGKGAARPRWMSRAGLEWCYRLARDPVAFGGDTWSTTPSSFSSSRATGAPGGSRADDSALRWILAEAPGEPDLPLTFLTRRRFWPSIAFGLCGFARSSYGPRGAALRTVFSSCLRRGGAGFRVRGSATRVLRTNGRRVLFACHAWSKYDRAFWKPFLLREQGDDHAR